MAERLAPQRDATLWGPPGTPEIADRLGWLTIAERMLGELDDSGVRRRGARRRPRDVVLLGMGGSSLAPEVLRRCFGTRAEAARACTCSTRPTPAAIARRAATRSTSTRTLFLVSSKSGGTIEPLSLFAHFYALVRDGADFVGDHRPGLGLEELAPSTASGAVFPATPTSAGATARCRRSARAGRADRASTCARCSSGAAARLADTPSRRRLRPAARSSGPPAVWLGAALSALARQGRDKLTFVDRRSAARASACGSSSWSPESPASSGTGILPVADEPLGEPGGYGEDRVFVAPARRRAAPDADARRARARARRRRATR